MSGWLRRIHNERGVALPLALIVLVVLTGLVLAYVTLGSVEPQISANLSDGTRARYVAEAGVEWAMNFLAGKDWSLLLVGPDGVTGNADDSVSVTNVASKTIAAYLAQNSALPGLTAAQGSFTVTIRNDSIGVVGSYPGDTKITGQGAIDPGGDKTDSNGIVIIESVGSFTRGGQTVVRRIEVVVKRASLNLPGALNLPGLQADTYVSNTNFSIDGRDYKQVDSWSSASPTGVGAMKLGIATQPGIQSNVGITYEQNVQNGFDTAAKKALVRGKHQTSGADTTGDNTIGPDSTLTPAVMADFLAELSANPATTVIQSSLACPLVLTGSSGSPSTPALSTAGSGCPGSPPIGTNVNLGTVANPKLVYFRGELDTSSSFNALRLNGTIRGAGILVVEDGDMSVYASDFQWDGIVIVTGRYVGMGYRSGSNSRISGGLVGLETVSGEAGGFFEFLTQASSLKIRSSQENRDMALRMLALQRITAWREN